MGPGKTPTVHWGPYVERAWVAQSTRTTTSCKQHMAHHFEISYDIVFVFSLSFGFLLVCDHPFFFLLFVLGLSDCLTTLSQDSLHWAFSKRFKKCRLNYNVNLSSSKKDHVQRHLYGENEETQNMYYEFCYSCELCSQIPARTLVILGAWIREEMVRNLP